MRRIMQNDERNHIELAILRALKDLHFGSVEIIVHDSKVVLIERREKMRLDTAVHHYVRKA
jgi:hypothetical protein